MENLTIQQVIADYGYWALFVGTFLEGETFFLLGGIAARQGMLTPWGVALAALGGGFIGDQIFFLLGRWRGVELMASSRRLARKAVKARTLVRRHALALVLLSRFLYGFRMMIPLACGTSGVHWLTFLALNFASAVAWTLVFWRLGDPTHGLYGGPAQAGGRHHRSAGLELFLGPFSAAQVFGGPARALQPSAG